MDAETGSGEATMKQRFVLKCYVHKNHLHLLMENKISSYSFEDVLRTQMLWRST